MDQYTIGQVLGQGTYGKVFLGTHKNTQLIRAIKQVKKPDVSCSTYNDIILEILITKQMNHHSILALHEIYQDQKHFYLVLDLCKGGELFERIKSLDNFQAKDIQYIMKQIFQAVNYFHSNQIVHRDLKPENILFEDQRYEIKIIDFGLSTYINPEEKLNKKAGSIFYMSPEQIQQNYDEKCDIWACGIILYILISGSPPFYGKNETQIKNKILSGKYSMSLFFIIKDGSAWKNIDNDTKDLIKQLLTLNPKNRITAQNALNHPYFQKNLQDNKYINFTSIKQNLQNFDVKYQIIWQIHLKKSKIFFQICILVKKIQQFHISYTNQYGFDIFFKKNTYLKKQKIFQANNKFKNAVMKFISSQVLSFQDTKELKQMFIDMDTNGDGSITFDEYQKSLSTTGIKSQQEMEEIKQLFKKVDLDGSGHIDYNEFLTAMSCQQEILNLDNLRLAFNMFDQDGNQQLTKQEVQNVLCLEDEKKLQQMMEKYDINGDGTINFNEFIDLIKEQIKEETKNQ